MINKIKETLGQVFFSPEASGTWEEKIECAIDEVTVKCEDLGSTNSRMWSWTFDPRIWILWLHWCSCTRIS